MQEPASGAQTHEISRHEGLALSLEAEPQLVSLSKKWDNPGLLHLIGLWGGSSEMKCFANLYKWRGLLRSLHSPAPSLYGLGDCDTEEGIQSDLLKVTQLKKGTKLKPPPTLAGAMENNRDHDVVGHSRPNPGEFWKPVSVFALNSVGTRDHVLYRGIICKELMKSSLFLKIIPMTSAQFEPLFLDVFRFSLYDRI